MGMSPERLQLKAELLISRKRWTVVRGKKLGYRTVCDLCGALDPTDLHECIISRAEAGGLAAVLEIILANKYNCQLLCNPCNVAPKLPKDNFGFTNVKDYLIARQLYRYTDTAIAGWIKSEVCPVSAHVATVALSRLSYVSSKVLGIPGYVIDRKESMG